MPREGVQWKARTARSDGGLATEHPTPGWKTRRGTSRSFSRPAARPKKLFLFFVKKIFQ